MPCAPVPLVDDSRDLSVGSRQQNLGPGLHDLLEVAGVPGPHCSTSPRGGLSVRPESSLAVLKDMAFLRPCPYEGGTRGGRARGLPAVLATLRCWVCKY